MIKSLSIDLIRTDGGTQMRAELDRDVYMDYRDKFLAGVEFPEVDVFHDGSTYWLADGFHRFYGAREAKRGSIKCKVHQGTVRDAILFAVGANQTHGLKRTNEDKRNSILKLLTDNEWVLWADNKIAEACGVVHQTVAELRKELAKVASSPAAKTKDEPKLGKDGKKRKPPKAKAEKEVKAKKEDGKISGGTSFDVAEIESAATPKAPKNGAEVKPEFDDAACKALYVKLVKLLDDRWTILGGQVGHRTVATKRLGESFEAYQKWVKG